jgi:hypothetical protein
MYFSNESSNYEDKDIVELKEIPEYDLSNSDYVNVKSEYCNICARVHIVTDGLYNLPLEVLFWYMNR